MQWRDELLEGVSFDTVSAPALRLFIAQSQCCWTQLILGDTNFILIKHEIGGTIEGKRDVCINTLELYLDFVKWGFNLSNIYIAAFDLLFIFLLFRI